MNKQTFVREVAARLECDPQRATGITFVVLQELRNRLTPKEVRDVAAQLPAGLKRFWLEHDHPDRHVARTHRTEFLDRIRRWAALVDDPEAERAVRAVFGVLQTLLGSTTGMEGESWDIFSQLPKDLKTLWLAANATPAPMRTERQAHAS